MGTSSGTVGDAPAHFLRAPGDAIHKIKKGNQTFKHALKKGGLCKQDVYFFFLLLSSYRIIFGFLLFEPLRTQVKSLF